MKRWLTYIFSAVVALAGCAENPDIGGNGGKARVRVNMLSSEFELVETRVLDTQSEYAWDNVWIAQFIGGNLVGTPKYYEEGSWDRLLDVTEGSDCVMYFITNMGSATNPFDGVTTLAQFEQKKYTISSHSDIDGSGRLVMSGRWPETGTASVPSGGNIMDMRVFVDRLTAKLDVIINVNQSASLTEYQVGYLRMKSFRIFSVPASVSFAEGSDRKATAASEVYDLPAETLTQSGESGGTMLIYRPDTYYILENMQGVHTYTPGASEPAENLDQYKNKAAEGLVDGTTPLATYMEIYGEVDDGINKGDVTYRIYLGGNAQNDFNIIRNHHYTVTVTINGIGDVTTDIRVDGGSVSKLRLNKLNGNAASNRGREDGMAEWDDDYYGSADGSIAANQNSMDTQYVDSGDDDWGFYFSSFTPATAETTWGCTLSYLPPAGQNVDGSYYWTGDQDDTNWIDMGSDTRGLGNTQPIPSGSRWRLNIPDNTTAGSRSVIISFFNGDVIREWNVVQKAYPGFYVPDNAFFPGEAGIYAVPVRSNGVEWRLGAGSATNITFIGAFDSGGNLVSNQMAGDDWVSEHGNLLFSVNANTNSSYRSFQINVEAKSEDGTSESKLVTIQQAPTNANLLADPKNLFTYSTDALFDSAVASRFTVKWAMDMIDGDGTDYNENEWQLGAWSSADGKANTLLIIDKIDKKLAELTDVINSNGAVTVGYPPVVTPAMRCMMLNDNYRDIIEQNDTDHPDFIWYLPTINEAVMDATFTGKLRRNDVNNYYGIWSSTTRQGTPDLLRRSAYTAAISVDVSLDGSEFSSVRCIRRRAEADDPAATVYPRIAITSRDEPVIIVRETVDGTDKGYVYPSRTPATATGDVPYLLDYNISLPIRYTRAGGNPAVDGKGPTYRWEKTLSPMFQVAKEDADMAVVGMKTGNWFQAMGWDWAPDTGNLISSTFNPADPKTGCNAYTEGGYTDWRAPTEMEIRMIALLNGMNFSAADANTFAHGTTFFDTAGFVPINTSYYYWSSNLYTADNSRAVYIRFDGFVIGGSAVAYNRSHRIRCVRDVNVID